MTRQVGRLPPPDGTRRVVRLRRRCLAGSGVATAWSVFTPVAAHLPPAVFAGEAAVALVASCWALYWLRALLRLRLAEIATTRPEAATPVPPTCGMTPAGAAGPGAHRR